MSKIMRKIGKKIKKNCWKEKYVEKKAKYRLSPSSKQFSVLFITTDETKDD